MLYSLLGESIPVYNIPKHNYYTLLIIYMYTGIDNKERVFTRSILSRERIQLELEIQLTKTVRVRKPNVMGKQRKLKWRVCKQKLYHHKTL